MFTNKKQAKTKKTTKKNYLVDALLLKFHSNLFLNVSYQIMIGWGKISGRLGNKSLFEPM